jgi:hypothetical protein
MISPEAVRKLVDSPEKQCLTVYFNTGPNLSRSTFRPRLTNLLRRLATAVPATERRAFDRVAEKVMNYFDQHRTAANSVLILATEKEWQEFSSRVPVRDEAWWGRPSVNQLLWLLEEYRPYGLLVVDQQKVRFLAVRLNEFEEFREFAADIDVKDWRRQQVGTARGSGAFQKGGKDVDAFNGKYMEHLRGFWRTLHKPLAELVERYHVRQIVLAGSRSLLSDFSRTLPVRLRSCIITQISLESFSNPNDAVNRVWPEIESWEDRRGSDVVTELLNAAGVSSKAAVGIEPSLKFIQDGRAARVIVAKAFDRDIVQCLSCRYVTTNHTDSCRKCSASDLEKGALALALPRLVVENKVLLDVVKGNAADELTRNGGIGVFLRY